MLGRRGRCSELSSCDGLSHGVRKVQRSVARHDCGRVSRAGTIGSSGPCDNGPMENPMPELSAKTASAPGVIASTALDQLFRHARTYRGSAQAWLDRPVSDTLLQEIYDLAKLGPTSANCCPARFVFIRTATAKAVLRDALDEGNVAQSMAAPVTVIVASDYAFSEKLPQLFPHTDARSWFVGKPALIEATAFRNASLQGAYLMMAARALGLDCGPMSGFDGAKLDAHFFAGTEVRCNFLINLGYGNPDSLLPRSPRLAFDEACQIA